MLEETGSEELLTIRCKECGYEFLAEIMPDRCPNPKCRRTAKGNPVGRPKIRLPSSADLDSNAAEQVARERTML
jgi:hypothetical protein